MVEVYTNNFGELDRDGVTVTVYNKKQKILLKNIVKTRFIKKQKYHLNGTSLLVSTYLLFFIKNNSVSDLTQGILFLIALMLLMASFYIKLFQYTFLVIKKNDFIAINVTKKLSQDAENLANRLEKGLTF